MTTSSTQGTVGQWGLHMADGFVRRLDERERRILLERLAADHPVTLESLGEAFGVSRERVRQIEKGVRDKLALEDWPELCEESIGRSEWLMHLDQLRDRMPAWFTPAEIATATHPYMPTVFDLIRASGAIQVTRSLWVTCNIEDGPDGDPSIPDDLGLDIEVGTATRLETGRRLEALGLDLRFFPDWLEDHGFYVRHGRIRQARETVEEFLIEELRDFGRPVDKARIERWIEGRWTFRSTMNRVQSDPRFSRVDTDTYALAEWNLRGYSTIRDAIGDLLAEQGATPLREVVETLCAWFDVAPKSVEQYAGQAPFRVRDGVVDFTGHSTALVRGTSPTITDITQDRQRRHWFVTPTGHTFRIHLTEDHLRGSGWPTSLMAAVVAGVASGAEWTMPFQSGPGQCKITRRFNKQPNFGSIKVALEAQGARIGDLAFIDFIGEPGDITSVGIRVVHASDLPTDPFDLALVLVGAPVASLDPFEEVRRAVGMDSDFAEDLVSVAKSRGDKALMDALNTWTEM